MFVSQDVGHRLEDVVEDQLGRVLRSANNSEGRVKMI